MSIDGPTLVSHLDDAWRTVPAIKRRIGDNGWAPEDICEALRTLAAAGRIEKRERLTTVPKFRKSGCGVLRIEFYRRLQ